MMVPRIPKAHLVVCHCALALTILQAPLYPIALPLIQLRRCVEGDAFWLVNEYFRSCPFRLLTGICSNMPVDRRAVGAVVVLVGLAFVVVVIAVMISIMLTSKLARSVANAPNTRASTSRKTSC